MQKFKVYHNEEKPQKEGEDEWHGIAQDLPAYEVIRVIIFPSELNLASFSHWVTTQNYYSPVFFLKKNLQTTGFEYLFWNSKYRKAELCWKKPAFFSPKLSSFNTPGSSTLTHAHRIQKTLQAAQLPLARCFACAVVNSLLVEFVVIVWAALHTHAFVVVNYSCIKMAFCQQQQQKIAW